VVRFSAWDNWELVEEYATGLQRTEGYLQGATGVIKTLVTNRYYYQDKLGSTTHVANASGALLESYRYDLYGTPSYFNSTFQPLNSSTYNVADLYAGERWVSELRVYDLRNRFMSPDLGRFLQPDPIGFKGDASNLYRYCGNDPIDKSDPLGLDSDIYLYRDYADRDAPGRYVIHNSAHKQIYSGPANQNPFFKDTHGVAAGEYKLAPKGTGWGRGVFDEHQPAITGYADGLKPGQPNKSYTHGPALVHKGNPYGTGPDSAGCVTVDSIGEGKTKEVMADDRKTNGVTRFHIRERQRKPGEPEIRRAQSVHSRATDDANGLGEGGKTDGNNDSRSVDQFIKNYLMGSGDNSGEGFHRSGPR
jgi:RHS repeat-associated protein